MYLRRVEMAWKPIESAPKNKAIIISSPEDGVMEAVWRDRWAGAKKQGFVPANLDEEYGWLITDATHWMLLPRAPKR